MGNVKIKEIPKLHIVELTGVEALRISQLTGVEPLRISQFTGVEPLRIGQIAPAAVHIKELNHIDPISVDSLRIDEIRNLDPVRVEKFDVTHLPTVNLSLSRVPGVDLNVRRVPPVSIGVHQEFCLPSSYTVHAKLLGVELVRLNIYGHTMVMPKDRYQREQAKTHERSFAEVAAVGNPAIPTRCRELSAETFTPAAACGPGLTVGPRSPEPCAPPPPGGAAESRPARRGGGAPAAARPGLSAGPPRFHFSMTPSPPDRGGSAVSSG